MKKEQLKKEELEKEKLEEKKNAEAEKKVKKNEKKLKQKMREIEAYAKVINKETGKWVYMDKNGKTSEMVFDKDDKAFEIKQRGKKYYGWYENVAIAIADIDELGTITEVLNNPDLFLIRFNMHDYISDPGRVHKTFKVCMLSLKSQIRYNNFTGTGNNNECYTAMNRIKEKYFSTMKVAMHIRKHKIHYAMHQYGDGSFCYTDSKGHKSEKYGPESTPLCLSCDHNGGYSASLTGHSSCYVPFNNLEDLDTITTAVKTPGLLSEMFGIEQHQERPEFVESVYDLVVEKLENDSTKATPEEKSKLAKTQALLKAEKANLIKNSVALQNSQSLQ